MRVVGLLGQPAGLQRQGPPSDLGADGMNLPAMELAVDE